MKVRVILDGDGAFPEMADDTAAGNVLQGELTAVTALPGGMVGGGCSVALIGELENGKKVFMETSLRLFQMAAAVFTGKYGDVTGEVKAEVTADGVATITPDEGH
jgi:hypothetical protein